MLEVLCKKASHFLIQFFRINVKQGPRVNQMGAETFLRLTHMCVCVCVYAHTHTHTLTHTYTHTHTYTLAHVTEIGPRSVCVGAEAMVQSPREKHQRTSA